MLPTSTSPLDVELVPGRPRLLEVEGTLGLEPEDHGGGERLGVAADLEQGDPHEELLGRTQRPCDKYSPRRARMPRGTERSLDRDV